MILETERFGTLHIDEEVMIQFPEGILGFESLTCFILLDRKVSKKASGAIQFLQAIDDPAIAFAVLDPHTFRPDYVPQLWDADREVLNIQQGDQLQILTILTVPEEVRDMTANLMAPIINNKTKRLGRQVVQRLGEYATRHRLVDELERAKRLVSTEQAEVFGSSA